MEEDSLQERAEPRQRGGKGEGEMFLGTHQHLLDEKGRLILPARFREELAPGLVITKGQERCLYVWPTLEFARLTESMSQAPVTSKEARDYMRVMFAGAHDEIPDKQGRITIPSPLRAYAGLARECVVIGANTRVEIWDATAWESYLAAQEENFSEISGEVFPGLF
jgi:MraZ protein